VALPLDRELVHILPQEFTVDDQRGIRDPIGMTGVRLEAEVHIVTGAIASTTATAGAPEVIPYGGVAEASGDIVGISLAEALPIIGLDSCKPRMAASNDSFSARALGLAPHPHLDDLFQQSLFVGHELVQRRVKQPYCNRQAAHFPEYSLEILALHRQQLVKRFFSSPSKPIKYFACPSVIFSLIKANFISSGKFKKRMTLVTDDLDFPTFFPHNRFQKCSRDSSSQIPW
jgi:hypothetical protein